jgi:hypothetical protein
MTSIRKFVYATLLGLTTISFSPSLAVAQDPATKGRFTLTHEVHWQNSIVPAGDYRFTFESDGAAGVLKLSRIGRTPDGFIVLVREMEESRPGDINRLVLDNSSGGSYVEALELPQFGVTLRFAVPSRAAEKLIAGTGAAAPGAAR